MLRILSDLHLYDGASRVRSVGQLAPLLDGPDHLVINGDSCDTQVGTTPQQVADLRGYLEERLPRLTLLTGNHDPDISSQHELLLAEDRMWVTHGDVFFRDLTPWSRLLPELRRRIAAATAPGTNRSLDRLDDRLEVFRQVSIGLPIELDLTRRDLMGRCLRLRHDLGSPRRILAMLRAWREGSQLGAELATAHRPTAEVIVFGHIHRPSVRQIAGRLIINTGAFAGPFGATCVDLEQERVTVRPVELRRGSFRPGAALAEFALARRASTGITS